MKRESPAADPAFRKKVFTIGVVCFFLIMVVTSLFGKKGVMDLHGARRKLSVLEARVRELERDRSKLEKEIRELETDPRSVEKAAREKLGLAAPGEKVVILPPPKK